MPVDTSESFVLIEGAATSCEGVVVEHLLVQVFQFVRQVVRITVTGIEMNTAVAVLLENRTEVFLHDGQVLRLIGQVVEFQETFSASVRVKHVTALILTVKVGRTHRVQQVGSFFSAQQTGREHGYLTFQHLVQMADLDIVVREADEVICLIQSVRPFVGANRIVDLMQRSGAELLQFGLLERLHLAAETGIDLVTVRLAGRADDVNELLGIAIRVRVTDRPQEVQGLGTDLHIGLNELLQERHVAAHVTERDHGRAVTHQGVVGIVPFGP